MGIASRSEQEVADDQHLPRVDLSFAWGGLEDPAWKITRADISEEISGLYEARIELHVSEFDGDPNRLLGRHATLRVDRGSRDRKFHGVVRRVDLRGEERGNRSVVQLVLVPALWLLSKRSNSRVFHHVDVFEIVRRVLHDAGIYQGEGELELHVVDQPRTYKTREYCVQHRETDLDFVRRLLEEEGLAFYFRHDEPSTETLSIVDGALGSMSTVYPDVTTLQSDHRIQLVGTGLPVEYETLDRFGSAAEVRSGGVVTRDFDFTNVLNPASVTVERPRGRRPEPLTVYEYPGRYTFVDLDDPRAATRPALRALPVAGSPPQNDEHSGARVADLAYEELRSGDRVYEGTGNVTGLRPGTIFELVDHTGLECEQEYLVTRITHEIDASEERLGGTHSDHGVRHERYRNRFECIPRSVTFRPERRTKRPAIHGVQTATVVGHPGEEVYTDWYGRVKVQFHWDRENSAHRNDRHRYGEGAAGPDSDPDSLCWVRVAQSWAGAGFGAMFIPRIGMEVVVSFLEGDPDRPLIVGCLYNNANSPPHELPSSANVSTIKTRSTPTEEGAHVGFNELRFDDSVGREEMYVHAERDYNEHVEHDHTTTVDRDQNIVVHRNQDTSVVFEQTVSVGGSQTNSVAGSHRTNVAGNHSESIVGNANQTVVGNRERTVVANETVKVYGTRTLDVRGATTQTFAAPYETVIMAHDPESKKDHDKEDEDDGDASAVKYAEKYTVQGHRLVTVKGLEQRFLEGRRTRIDHNDRTMVAKEHLVNAGWANLLVGDMNKPDTLQTGYYFSDKKVRVGSQSKDLEDMRVFRGDEKLWFQKDKVSLETKGKDLVLEVVETGCKITLSSDGKKISIEAAESIEFKAGKASLKIDSGITLDAGGGAITLK